jgi:NDP-sugar pyrophosphorylase family protein
MKERLTITLDRDILRGIDASIKGPIKNRSQAIEHLIAKSLTPSLPKKAVILCGGAGTRLRPITYEIPKPLMPVQGKPMVEHLLDLFKKHGVTDIVLTVGYKKELIKKHFGDGKKFGVSISYVEEDKPLGTAGCLGTLELTEPFFVANADELKNIDLQAMYRTHRKNKATCTIALTTVSDPSSYGVAQLSGSRIQQFVEKPKKEEAPSRFINAGLYICEPSVLGMIDGHVMFEQDIFPKVAEEQKLFGHPFSGQWFDTGTMERYEKALREWRGV